MVELSIIIVSYNSYNEIAANIESIFNWLKSFTFEIIIVNNYAGDAQLYKLADADNTVRIIESGANLGFAKANNIGVHEAKGEFILFLNPDTLMLSDINALLVLLKTDDKIGLIGPLVKNRDLTLLPSCGEYPTIKNWLSSNLFLNKLFPKVRFWGNLPMGYFKYRGIEEVDWISGAFMLGRKDVINRIGGFDESFFMFCEDIDICWRMNKAGYKIIFSDQAGIIHLVGHSVKKKSAAKAKMMVDSLSILLRKFYNSDYAKKMFIILFTGSVIRKLLCRLMYIVGINRNNSMINYYDTVISETSKYIKI